MRKRSHHHSQVFVGLEGANRQVRIEDLQLTKERSHELHTTLRRHKTHHLLQHLLVAAAET